MPRLLKFILLLIVVAGAAIGGTIFVMSRHYAAIPLAAAQTDATTPAAPPPVIPTPIFAELDPFTVTLYGETRNRILYVAITLRLGDQRSQKQIHDYMPEVRDRILKVLSGQDLTSIQTPQGRQMLADAIQAKLSTSFAAQLPGPQVMDVLFTAFVVQ